jgi:Lon protease-like protein
MFGMIQPDLHGPEGPNGAGLYRVGCLGRISSFNETDDGRLLITLSGLIRFRVLVELELRNGYRRVRGEFTRYRDDLRQPAETDIKRDAIMVALRTYFAQRGVDANWDAIKAMSDDNLIVTLAMACPFEPVEKQALLEAMTGADRAATLLTLLQMGAAGPGGPTQFS